MKIVWDEPKRTANLEKHGLDFADLTLEFFEAAHLRTGHSGRWRAIGAWRDGIVTVVFATLGAEAISIVSMRAASRRERKLLDV